MIEIVSRSKVYVWSSIIKKQRKKGSVVCMDAPVPLSVPEMEGIYMPMEGILFEDDSLVEFRVLRYIVFICMPGGVTVGDSGLCCCVPCLSNAAVSPCLLVLHRHSRPHSVSDYNNSL